MVLARVDGVRCRARAVLARGAATACGGALAPFGCPGQRPRGFDGTGALRQRPSYANGPALRV